MITKGVRKRVQNRARRYKYYLNQKGSKLANALRKMGKGNESRLDNIRWKKCWVREVSLAVYACGER